MSDHPILKKLNTIKPSTADIVPVKFYPCSVVLKDGKVLERVLFASKEQYIQLMGKITPDREKYFIDIETVADLKESPLRLPADLADKLYKAGESGMGCCIFTMVMKNGDRVPCSTGNIVDFPQLPQEYKYADIIDVVPHEGRDAEWTHKPVDFKRCLF